MNRARRCLSTITIDYNLHTASVLCAVALGLSAAVGPLGLSKEASRALWPWQGFIPSSFALNALLLLVLGTICSAKLRPLSWGQRRRANLQPLVAKRMYYILWLALNMAWLAAGISKRDFAKMPKWLRSAASLSEPAKRVLAASDHVGMAACWPLLANLFLVLLPVDRSASLLSCIGVGYEDGVRAHAWCGTATWLWVSMHALLTQAPMAGAGLWSTLMLPSPSGADTRGVANFMGLVGWAALCLLGASSLAAVRRRYYNVFYSLHLLLAPIMFFCSILHDEKVFWWGLLGGLFCAADHVQRLLLRRRAVRGCATIHGDDVGDDRKYVTLHIPTSGPPGCFAGQHVWIKVPCVSAWEWHPYSVAGADECGFFLMIKAGGDWERRMCLAVERRAATFGTAQIDVVYEGLYGPPDVDMAAASSDVLLLFAGGVGITPIASILQALLQGGGRQRQRVHLVWAVAAEADALPAAPMLQAAAARGWEVDLHCTQSPPAGKSHTVLTQVQSKAPEMRGLGVPADLHSPPPADSVLVKVPAADAAGVLCGAVPYFDSTPGGTASLPPWQLVGFSAWAVTALAGAAAAAGRVLGSAAFRTHECAVGASGVDAMDATAVSQWVAGVRTGFAAGAVAGGPGGGDDDDEGGGAGIMCPVPGEGPHLKLHVCGAWWQQGGDAAAELLCVKCDPLRPRSALEEAWPCCRAATCYFGMRLAPLLGAVLGAVLGAALACCALYIWARVSRCRRGCTEGQCSAKGKPRGGASGGGSGGSSLLLELVWRCSGGRAGRAAGSVWDAAGGADEDKGGDACGGETAELLPHLKGDGDWKGCASNNFPYGARPVVGAPLASAALAKVPNSTPAPWVASSLPAGVRVHHGRPNVDSYCARSAAFWTHWTGKLEEVRAVSPGGGEPSEVAMRGQGACGVVVCGPASLQQAVEEAFQRHLAKAKGCWFRGFSFTS